MHKYKHIFYDRQTRTWIGRFTNLKGDQIGDCEYFPNRKLAEAWKMDTTYLKPDYQDDSMWKGFDKQYF